MPSHYKKEAGKTSKFRNLIIEKDEFSISPFKRTIKGQSNLSSHHMNIDSSQLG